MLFIPFILGTCKISFRSALKVAGIPIAICCISSSLQYSPIYFFIILAKHSTIFPSFKFSLVDILTKSLSLPLQSWPIRIFVPPISIPITLILFFSWIICIAPPFGRRLFVGNIYRKWTSFILFPPINTFCPHFSLID